MYGDTVTVDERFLGPLGVHRIPVPVPFVEAGGPVNAYAILNGDGTYTLFDTGVATPDGLAALRGGAAEQGVDLRRVSRIIVSHGHVDHFGNAQTLAEESGARVVIHDADRSKVLGEERFSTLLARHRGYFLSLGVPGEVLEQMQALAARGKPVSRPIEAHRLGALVAGERFSFAHFDAEVLHLPGHTPGLVCLHAPAHKLLFADDHLLERVSPNPLLDFSQGEGETKFRALARYLESARAVHALELDCVLPGHGPAFRGHRSLLDGLFEFYGRRQEKIRAFLAKRPASPYEVVDAVFPRRDVPRLVLMLSEIVANLEVMEDAGAVRRALVDGVITFSVA